ncbi:hypothetical protein DL96DRAFT_1557032 [Flagelloscypha sp. PMI_526]|nr:hypothetical protein DL96DRAFT_1557032 [Flagelloscypha sp. PMI_526]
MASRYNLRIRPRQSEPSALLQPVETQNSQLSKPKQARSHLLKVSTSFPALPLEIIHHIVASSFPETTLLVPQILSSRKRNGRRAASLDPCHHLTGIFKRCTLVCKFWARIAQSIFYQTLVFRSTEQVFRLATTLSSWAADYSQSPLRHVRGIHFCVELDQNALNKVEEIVQCIRAATQIPAQLETIALSWLGTCKAAPIPWVHVPVALAGFSIVSPLRQIPTFCHALQILHVLDVIFEATDDAGRPLCPGFPFLVELRLTVRPRASVYNLKPGNWSLPSLRSITVSGWCSVGRVEVITFLPFLRKYGSQVNHFFLDGYSRKAPFLSSYLSWERIQDCLDALPELRHLVLTQMPWMSFRGQRSEITQFTHTKLTWIDYGVIPSVANFLDTDKTEFIPTAGPVSFTDVPRIRGGARTKGGIPWNYAFIAELATPGPVPPGWGSELPNLQGLRKVDFSLFPLMPSLTRDILPPVLGHSETWISFSEDAVIRETKGRVYLSISKSVLRKKLYKKWEPHRR